MIYALVTLFNPTVDQINNLHNINKQVDKVIVCDNSRSDNSMSIPEGISYYHNGKNLGLSAAFNWVLKDKNILWNDNDFVVFFDQDSKIEDGHIKRLVEDYTLCERSGIKIGCLGPVFFNTSNNSVEIPHSKKKVKDGIYEVKSIITSSLICKYGSLKRIKYWNEEVFLDMADWDLCWRFQRAGYKCLMTTNIALIHSVGTGEKKIALFHMRVGAPIREYYQIRDCLYLKRKRYTPFKFKIRFIAMLTVRSLIHALFYDCRKKRIGYIKRGVKDYKKGIHGEYCE